MAPSTVRLVLVEGENADGVTVEEDNFEVAAAAGGPPTPGATADQVVAAIIGTREGAVEGGYRLASTGVTWTDPAAVGALRDELAIRDVGGVMLVSPLLAAAALTQTVGFSLGYEHIAILFVEPSSATLAVVDVADGSIVDLHRQPVEVRQGASQRAGEGVIAAQLATMLAGLDARRSRADGVFLIGCGTDIVSIKPALEAVTSLDVSAPEEPDMALARGAAVASANAPLFASSTAALAYALDPGTGEVSPRAFHPTYLDVSANADLGDEVRAYSALGDAADEDGASPRRRAFMLAGSAPAAITAVVAGVLVFSLTSDRPSDRHESTLQHNQHASVATPAQVPGQVPAHVPSQPPQAQLPAPSSPPPAPPPAVAAPPTPPPVVEQAPPPTANVAPITPAPVRRAPAPRAPAPMQQAAPPPAAPPPAPPAPPPAAPAVPAQPPITMYLHFPFVTIPIPITPPPPPAPPPGP
jgi:hypothetical protein